MTSQNQLRENDDEHPFTNYMSNIRDMMLKSFYLGNQG